MNYVNYTSLERIPKLSASWYRDYVSKNKYFGGRERYQRNYNANDDNEMMVRPGPYEVDFMLVSLILIAIISLMAVLLHKQTDTTKRRRNSSMYIELDQSIRGDCLKGEDESNHLDELNIRSANEFTIEDVDDDNENEGDPEQEI